MDQVMAQKFLARERFKKQDQLGFSSLKHVLGFLGGLAIGWEDGIELNVLTLTFGVDFKRPALKLPLVGRLGAS